MNSEEMTGSNVVITQDSMDAGASTVGLLLSQDTISSVEFDISQSRDNINSGDASSKLLRQVVSPVRPLNDADEIVVCTRQPPLPPPPLLVLCPNVNDVLFPMEGFTMWPGNMYCNSILQQLQSKYVASYNNREGQAQIILEIIKMIQSQQHSSNVKDDDSCNISCSKFLKAIQVPYRNNKQNQNSNHQSMDLQRFSVHDDRGEAIPSKTIWEVMRESDVVIELEKILEFRSESNHSDATTNHNKNQAAENEESQIPASSMAILQGLYYVPNYYPSRTQKQSHEYGSGDEESVVSYDSSSEEDDDDIDDENGSMKIKRRRVIHRTMDDFKPTTKPSKASVSSNNTGKTDTKPTKKSIATQRVQHPPAVKVSMIGRITVDGDMHSSVASTGSSTTTPSVKVPIHSGGATTNKHHHQKVAFQYKPKSMTSHQAMIRQEGSDDLPKGVTVRPSGKWVRNFVHRCCIMYIAPQSLTQYYLLPSIVSETTYSKHKRILRVNRDMWVYTIPVVWQHEHTMSYKTTYVNIEFNVRLRKKRRRKN